MAITHHDLCFGCGLANLFGLQLEVERDGAGGVAGRVFVKQDHQGAPGEAHPGIVATALHEAMALALVARGVEVRATGLELTVERAVPVGAFAELAAAVESDDGERLGARATLRVDGEPAAEARATFVAIRPRLG